MLDALHRRVALLIFDAPSLISQTLDSVLRELATPLDPRAALELHQGLSSLVDILVEGHALRSVGMTDYVAQVSFVMGASLRLSIGDAGWIALAATTGCPLLHADRQLRARQTEIEAAVPSLTGSLRLHARLLGIEDYSPR